MKPTGKNFTEPGFNATYIYDLTDPVAVCVIGLLAVAGIFGNSLVVFIVFKYREMQTANNLFVSNLAKTDICFFVVCAVPTAITFANGGAWTLGDFMCRFVVYMQSVSVQATVGTFTAMTVDRCMVISNPLTSRARRSKRTIWITLSFIWIGSCLLHLPLVVFIGVVVVDPSTSSAICTSLFDNSTQLAIYTVYEVLVMYAVPLAVIGACNVCIAIQICTMKVPADMMRMNSSGAASEEVALRPKGAGGRCNDRACSFRRASSRLPDRAAPDRRDLRVTVMVMVIVVFFAVCWGPLHAVRLYMMLADINDYALLIKLNTYALYLAYFNSTMNPALYAFLGKRYRHYVKQIFSCGQGRTPRSRLAGYHHPTTKDRSTTTQTTALRNT